MCTCVRVCEIPSACAPARPPLSIHACLSIRKSTWRLQGGGADCTEGAHSTVQPLTPAHTHAHSLTHPHTPPRTRMHTRSHTRSHRHAPTHTRTLTHTPTHTHSHTFTYSLTHSHTPTLTHYVHVQSRSYAHSHAHGTLRNPAPGSLARSAVTLTTRPQTQVPGPCAVLSSSRARRTGSARGHSARSRGPGRRLASVSTLAAPGPLGRPPVLTGTSSRSQRTARVPGRPGPAATP